VTEKSNRQLDDEEFRPTGEGNHVPDRQLDSNENTNDYLDSEDYPARTETEHGICRGCRAAIPLQRSKCDSCLREHVEPLDVNSPDPARTWEFCHLIFAVVEAGTDYTAVAKGTAACTQLVGRDDDPIANYQSVAAFTEPPSTFLTDRWGDLPAATRIDTDTGERLLTRIQERSVQDGSDDGECDSVHDTYLYDEAGDGIRTLDQLESVQAAMIDPVWLIPAIALLPASPINKGFDRKSRREPMRGELLRCHSCGEQTVHLFVDYDSVPDPTYPDTPIWKCKRCSTPRFGPAPRSDG